MELSFERAAMRNDPMPDGLDFIDQTIYQGLAWLYRRYYTGAIDQTQAKAEKIKIVGLYNDLRKEKDFADRLGAHHVQMERAINCCASEYSRNPTIENADKLYKAIYGVRIRRKDDNS